MACLDDDIGIVKADFPIRVSRDGALVKLVILGGQYGKAPPHFQRGIGPVNRFEDTDKEWFPKMYDAPTTRSRNDDSALFALDTPLMLTAWCNLETKTVQYESRSYPKISKRSHVCWTTTDFPSLARLDAHLREHLGPFSMFFRLPLHSEELRCMSRHSGDRALELNEIIGKVKLIIDNGRYIYLNQLDAADHDAHEYTKGKVMWMQVWDMKKCVLIGRGILSEFMGIGMGTKDYHAPPDKAVNVSWLGLAVAQERVGPWVCVQCAGEISYYNVEINELCKWTPHMSKKWFKLDWNKKTKDYDWEEREYSNPLATYKVTPYKWKDDTPHPPVLLAELKECLLMDRQPYDNALHSTAAHAFSKMNADCKLEAESKAADLEAENAKALKALEKKEARAARIPKPSTDSKLKKEVTTLKANVDQLKADANAKDVQNLELQKKLKAAEEEVTTLKAKAGGDTTVAQIATHFGKQLYTLALRESQSGMARFATGDDVYVKKLKADLTRFASNTDNVGPKLAEQIKNDHKFLDGFQSELWVWKEWSTFMPQPGKARQTYLMAQMADNDNEASYVDGPFKIKP